MTHYLEHDHSDDDIDRRGFLRCMAWAGTGVVFTLTASGVTTNQLGSASAAAATNSFSFVQISDSHVGFDTAPNKDVIGTLERAVKKINALPQRPSFVVHTGDHVHLSTPDEFDTVKQILGTIRTGQVFNVPGEHDVFVDGGRRYLKFFGKGSMGSGYYSFDAGGAHFLGLSNVQASEAEHSAKGNGLGLLGHEQLAWIKQDLASISSETPIVDLWTRPAPRRLSEVGLGDRRQRAGPAGAAQVRFGDSAQRPHPPDNQQNGGQRGDAHRRINRLPAAPTGQRRPRAGYGPGRQARERDRDQDCTVPAGIIVVGAGRYVAGRRHDPTPTAMTTCHVKPPV